MEHTPKAADWKKKIIDDFVRLINEYPIVGTVNMENLPAKQLQNMRQQLRGTVVIKMAKRRLMYKAIEQAKEGKGKSGVEGLMENMPGMPALIFTRENPFALYKKVNKNKSSAPAKAGQVAPKDIIVPAGPTNFSPGPIIGELGMMRIKSGIENGKVAIKEDSIVAKEGEIIKPKLAEILTRLGIEPMEIGLDIVAIYENGEIYKKNILSIDESEYIGQVKEMAREAFNLAVFSAYPCAETTELLLRKGHSEALSLAMSENILTKETVGSILGKANSLAENVKNKCNI
ncbi:50S ribosomal protein L10 [Candidatus Woesearchaeota archaeon]|nr:50S ribosomal protein L10 [Candidatus Woesearchaeota archaeon]